MSLFNAIEAFSTADDRYQRELRHVYGPAARDARHDSARNAATPELARLARLRARARARYERVCIATYQKGR